MALQPGAHLGPYEILVPIGKGGMGEVYRARDSRLNRDVAIKVSAAQFSERFRREAEAVAALNHPHICTLYDVGPNYLVMEYIEGPTLGERIKQGAIPLEGAIGIAKQIASALEHAHEKAVIHRDLKPANVKLKADGSEYGFVKVLDFGLAKMGGSQTAAPPGAAAPPGEDSPTLTMALTEVGVILGTAAYMAPEQAKGKPVDKRADIFAFGVMLHEMLSGRRMFSGETISDTLAQVILKEPEWEGIPARAQRLLRWCLEKEPAKRLRDIGDAARLLDEEVPVERLVETAPSRSRFGRWGAWVAAGVMGVVAAGVGFVHFREVPPETPVRKLTVLPPEGAEFAFNVYRSRPEISPDGKRIVFGARAANGTRQLWIRLLDSPVAQPLPGTEGAEFPFWSPDSRWVGFTNETERKLKKIDVQGGPPLPLTDLTAQFRGGSWGAGNVVVFAQHLKGMWRVPAEGGTPTVIDPTVGLGGFPWFLPDGKHFLHIMAKEDLPTTTQSSLFVSSVDEPGKRKLVGQTESVVQYAEGYLTFLRGETLMAQPFDVNSLATTGEAIPLAEQIPRLSLSPSRVGVYGVAGGLLVHHRTVAAQGNVQLTWVDRAGTAVGTVGDTEPGLHSLALSPDQKSLVAAIPASEAEDLWIWDLSRGLRTRFTITGRNSMPSWSPDGSQIAYRSGRNVQSPKLYRKAANGTGA